MESFLFSLVVGFCSPVECQEFVLGHSLTAENCSTAAIVADGLYEPIPAERLYLHYVNKYGADLIEGLPDGVELDVKCTEDVQ